MTSPDHMPEGMVLTRTTDVFDNDTVPAGLLKAHRVADSVWGRLVVHSGSVRFVFEDKGDAAAVVKAGETLVIPPGRLHHVEPDAAATFAVEFYRRPADTDEVLESTGLA